MNSIIKPKILLSVKDIHEIGKVINYADIIDLKNPNDGPIGSWTIKNIKEVIREYNDIILSATLGNLQDLSEVKKKLSVFDSLGLNFIKIGCFCKSIKDLNKFLKFYILTDFLWPVSPRGPILLEAPFIRFWLGRPRY